MSPMPAYDMTPADAPPSLDLQPGSTLQGVTVSRRPDPPDRKKGGTMNPLARLIQRRRAELDLTWKELATKGGFTSHTTLYQLATKPVHIAPPRLDTLRRLAVALEVPENVVRAAAFEAANHTVDETTIPLSAVEDIRVIAAGASEMSEHDRAIVRNLVESIMRTKREEQADS